MAGNTIKDVLDRNRGIGPGFDLLRMALAVIIFTGHVGWLTGHTHVGAMPTTAFNPVRHQGWQGWQRPFLVSWVAAFFALSGFLVMGSAVRTRSTQIFLAFRALRIFPALLVELSLSAILLGSFFTTLAPAQYFTDGGFFRYFGNLIGWVDFDLPGVFVKNFVPRVVNANLWTLPAEFDCYLISAALMLSSVMYRRAVMTAIFVAMTVAFIALNTFTNFAVVPTTLAPYTITYYFFVGVMFFQWRERIPVRWSLFLIAGLASYVLQMSHHTVYLAPVFVTYCTVFIGMQKFRKLPVISGGDYSYGIYLYGFPITQALLAAFPALHGRHILTLAVAGALTLGFAAFSWHVIEKRALAAKKHLPKRWFPVAEKAGATPPQLVELVPDRP
jgi:peptidoglycan/LPS O-acetylase OafA/YrhL